MILFLGSSALIVCAGISAFLFPARMKGIVYTVVSLVSAIMAIIPSIGILTGGTELAFEAYLGFPLGFVRFAIDPLSAFFILIIACGNFLVGLYSIGYMKAFIGKKSSSGFYVWLSFLFASMLLIVCARHTLAFCILWEIMSISSFFLVAYEHEKKESVDSAIYYLIAMQLGFVFILTGFILLSLRAGSFDFRLFRGALINDPVFATCAFFIFFVGFGTKSGFIPFHTWLPKAHPNAPTPVSAAMSGIMIKIGIYGIIRFVMMMGIPNVFLAGAVLIISLVTAVWGVLHAIAQSDIKRLLAYSSIENIGIIGIGIGLGMVGLSIGNPVVAFCGFAGSLLHVANHFLFKSLLFFGAGAVYHGTHTRNIEHLGGVAKIMPVTAVMFLIGTVAICGLPPLNGFVSEIAIYIGFAKGVSGSGWLASLLYIGSFAGLAFIGALALFCFTKAYGIIFSGTPRNESHIAKKEASPFMLIPMGIIALCMAAIGIFPGAVLSLVGKVIQSVSGTSASSVASYPLEKSFSALSSALLVLFIFLAVAFAVRFVLFLGKSNTRYKTWSCGYQAGSPRLEYTGSSFASIIQSVLAPLLRYRVNVLSDERLHNAYNRIVHIDTATEDVTERYVVKPVTSAVESVLGFFHWMQSGNTQQYILYGILFLIILIVVVFGVKL
jgi:hydrogenase-4 component B